ncbi:MAG: Lrp/AsnC family transcriptional regulator [Candidatus Bathyarchaeota archaeon]
MDELDTKILRILLENARTPFSTIGKKLGVSKDLVKRRYNRLKERNENLKSTVVLDFEKIGFKLIIGFSIKVLNESDVPKVKAELVKCPNIGYLSEQVGDFDFYLDVYLADINEICIIMEYLRQIDGIESLNPWFFRLNPNEKIPSLNELIFYSIK